jgi:hypothetical protein
LLSQDDEKLLQHAIQILQDVVIPEANDSVAGIDEKGGPLRVDRLIVLTTINLDYQCRIPAKEIDDVWLDCDLSSEFPAFQLSGTEP